MLSIFSVLLQLFTVEMFPCHCFILYKDIRCIFIVQTLGCLGFSVCSVVPQVSIMLQGFGCIASFRAVLWSQAVLDRPVLTILEWFDNYKLSSLIWSSVFVQKQSLEHILPNLFHSNFEERVYSKNLISSVRADKAARNWKDTSVSRTVRNQRNLHRILNRNGRLACALYSISVLRFIREFKPYRDSKPTNPLKPQQLTKYKSSIAIFESVRLYRID